MIHVSGSSSTALAMLSLLAAAGPAFADEAEAVPAAATEAAAATSTGLGPAEFVLLASPIVLYGVFTLYRNNISKMPHDGA